MEDSKLLCLFNRSSRPDIAKFKGEINIYAALGYLGSSDLSLPAWLDAHAHIIERQVDTSGYVWVPNIYRLPEEARVPLFGDAFNGKLCGLHNKPYLENDASLSEHERASVLMALHKRGWITKKA
jgi:hypothetical protein